MTVLAFLAFTAVFGLALIAMADTLIANMPKIAAALRGQSLLAEPMLVTRPVTVRMTSRRVNRPVSAQPRLRAAA